MKHDAFISYSSAEFEQALWVRNNLEANGISCWMAPDSIPGGASYGDTISTAIDHCQFFVLILSSKAQASQWVTKELDLALNAHVTVLPFMIEKCQLVGEFRLYLPNVQHYYAYADQMQAMEKLINDIRCQMCKPILPPTLLSEKNSKRNPPVVCGAFWGSSLPLPLPGHCFTPRSRRCWAGIWRLSFLRIPTCSRRSFLWKPPNPRKLPPPLP